MSCICETPYYLCPAPGAAERRSLELGQSKTCGAGGEDPPFEGEGEAWGGIRALLLLKCTKCCMLVKAGTGDFQEVLLHVGNGRKTDG